MSKSKDGPETPKRSPSSQGLLNTIRTLASTKPHLQIPDGVVTSPNTSNSSALPTGSLDLEAEDEEAKNAIPKMEDDTAADVTNVPIASENCVGGPPELQSLIEVLSSKGDVEERMDAAYKIERILKKFEVENVMGIWEAGKDLTRIKDVEGAEKAGYALLRACVKWKRLTPAERKYFFQFIGKDLPESDDAYKLQLLIELTDNGRYIESLERLVVPVWRELFYESFDAAQKARAQNKASATPDEPVQEKYLQQAFDFTSSLVKYNSKVLSEDHRTTILRDVNKLCMNATRQPDINNSFAIYKTFLNYSSYTTESLRSCLEVFCAVIATFAPRRPDAVIIVQSLLQSHLGWSCPPIFLDILAHGSSSHPVNTGVPRGALYVLRHLLCSDEWSNMPRPSLDEVLQAAQGLLEKQSTSFTSEFRLMLQDIATTENAPPQLFQDPAWTRLTEALTTLAPLKSRSCVSLPEGGAGEESSEANFMVDTIRDFAIGLCTFFQKESFEYRERSMEFMFNVAHCLPDDTIIRMVNLCKKHFLSPTDPQWTRTGEKLFETVCQGPLRTIDVRIQTLQILYDTYNSARALNKTEAHDFILNVIDGMQGAMPVNLMAKLNDIAIKVATWTTNEATFDKILFSLRFAILERPKGLLADSNSETAADEGLNGASGVTVATTLVRLFLRCIRMSASNTKKVYAILLEVAESTSPSADARVVVLKLLFRLRADISYAVFVTPTTDSEGLAAALCRTAESFPSVQKSSESPVSRPLRTEDQAAKRQKDNAPTAPPQLSRSRSGAGRVSQNTGRLTRPNPPLWMYPGPKGLPEDPPHASSTVIYSSRVNQRKDGEKRFDVPILESGRLLESVLRMLQQDELDWEIYSYIIVHLGALLTNHSLFIDAIPQIRFLRSVICQQINNKKFHEPPSYTNLRKTDVAVCLYHILTMLVSYNCHFGRSENDELAKMFVHGISTWERTSESCIHALSICCHEIPMSLVKHLQHALQNMTQILAQTHMAVHVLEFLTGLARLPKLFSNFRDEEFRMVFGICFRYLQIVRDAKEKEKEKDKEREASESRAGKSLAVALRGTRDLVSPSEGLQPRGLADELPQTYVYALTFHVMTFWFMSLEMGDRPSKLEWIIQNLVHKDSSGNAEIEEQSQVVIDLMYNIAYSDYDETAPNPNFATQADGMVTTKSWVVGLSILTVETAGRSGLSQITRRRPVCST